MKAIELYFYCASMSVTAGMLVVTQQSCGSGNAFVLCLSSVCLTDRKMIVTNMSSASGHLTNKRSFVLGFLFAIEKNRILFYYYTLRPPWEGLC